MEMSCKRQVRNKFSILEKKILVDIELDTRYCNYIMIVRLTCFEYLWQYGKSNKSGGKKFL